MYNYSQNYNFACFVQAQNMQNYNSLSTELKFPQNKSDIQYMYVIWWKDIFSFLSSIYKLSMAYLETEILPFENMHPVTL